MRKKGRNKKKKKESRKMGVALAIIGILLTLAIFYFSVPEMRKYVPFLPKPFIIISYHKQHGSDLNPDTTILINIENRGNAPANYFTADIEARTPQEWFSIKGARAKFDISTSGQAGSRITISAQKILPQQRGTVWLTTDNSKLELKPPKIKSDSRCKFIGTQEIKIGTVETYEEYKNKNP